MNIFDRYRIKLEKNKEYRKTRNVDYALKYKEKAKRLNEQNKVYREYKKTRKQIKINDI